MKRLSKGQLAARDDLIKRLRDASAAVSEMIGLANSKIEEYNAAVADVETFRDEIKGAQEEYEGERSDKWREGEGGSNYQDWMGEWDSLDPSPIDEVEEPDMDLADNLEGLPEEVSS